MLSTSWELRLRLTGRAVLLVADADFGVGYCSGVTGVEIASSRPLQPAATHATETAPAKPPIKAVNELIL